MRLCRLSHSLKGRGISLSLSLSLVAALAASPAFGVECGFLDKTNTDCTIPNGKTITSAKGFTHNITIDKGGALKPTGGTFSGTITNNGTITSTNAIFNGVVTNNGTIDIYGNNKSQSDFNALFTNAGTLNVKDGAEVYFTKEGGATNTNDGSLTIGNNAYAKSYSHFTNNKSVNSNGEFRVDKDLTNSTGATITADGQNALIQFGGNLSNSGTITLKNGARFVINLPVKDYKYTGTFTNSGTIEVDLSFMSPQTSYKSIKGYAYIVDIFDNLPGNEKYTPGFTIAGNAIEFTGHLNLYDYDCNTLGVCVATAKAGLSKEETNQVAVHTAISEAMQRAGLTDLGGASINQAMADTQTTLQKSAAAAPRSMMNAFKMDTSAAQLQGAIAGFMADAGTYYAAASSAVMSDASAYSGGRDSNLQIFATPFGGAFSGDGASGHLLGIALGATYFGENYIAQGSFAYANGSSTQDLATQSNELSANLLQLGGFGRYFLGKAVEIDANVNFVLGMFDLENSWANAATLNSSASFNDYEFNLGATGGYRFNELGVEAFSVKPFAGLQLYYNNQGSYNLDGLGLGVDSVSDFKMDILAGAEARYAFKNGNFAYLKLGYEQKLFNTAKDISVSVLGASGASSGALTYDNESYDGFFAANLGGRVLSINSWCLDIEGVFKHFDSGLNYFGGNLSVKYAF